MHLCSDCHTRGNSKQYKYKKTTEKCWCSTLNTEYNKMFM